MKCESCSCNEASMSAIVNGQYYKNVCSPCANGVVGLSSSHADYNRRFDAQTHQWEIAQPYTKDGTPSRDFIALYPDRARKIFSAEEVRKYG